MKEVKPNQGEDGPDKWYDIILSAPIPGKRLFL
jgi:hypothetical protein